MAPTLPNPHTQSRIAVILEEDEPTARLLSSILAQNGFTVAIAMDEDAALRLCREHSPVDLLLTNLIVQGRNALDLIRSVKNQWPTLKVIALTEYAAGVIRRVGGIHDAIPVLRKPVDAQALASAIGSRLWSLPRQAVRRTSRLHLRLVK